LGIQILPRQTKSTETGFKADEPTVEGASNVGIVVAIGEITVQDRGVLEVLCVSVLKKALSHQNFGRKQVPPNKLISFCNNAGKHSRNHMPLAEIDIVECIFTIKNSSVLRLLRAYFTGHLPSG
jgi:hypothetical protein